MTGSQTESDQRYYRSSRLERSFFYGVAFQLDPDRSVYERKQTYTWVDLVVDVGGLIVSLHLLATVAVHFLTGDELSILLVSRLFERRKNSRSPDERNKSEAETGFQELQSRQKTSRFSDWCQYCCLTRGVRKGFNRAKVSVQHELDFYSYFRKLRQFEVVLRVLFTSKERYLLSKQNCFVLNEASASEPSAEDVDSGAETGPKRDFKWWSELRTGHLLKIMEGLSTDRIADGRSFAPDLEAGKELKERSTAVRSIAHLEAKKGIVKASATNETRGHNKHFDALGHDKIELIDIHSDWKENTSLDATGARMNEKYKSSPERLPMARSQNPYLINQEDGPDWFNRTKSAMSKSVLNLRDILADKVNREEPPSERGRQLPAASAHTGHQPSIKLAFAK